MDEKLGVKETVELIEGIKPVVVCGVKVANDKQVNLDDLEHLGELAKNLDKVLEGAKGADQALKELKDLDKEEMLIIMTSVYSLVSAIKEARKA